MRAFIIGFMSRSVVLFALAVFGTTSLYAQSTPASGSTCTTEPVVRSHKLTVNGKTLEYTSTTGLMPLRNSTSGEHEADIFFNCLHAEDMAYLPSYAATAWYHKKLPGGFAERSAQTQTLKEVEQWAISGYQEALAKGDKLHGADRKAALHKTARYTGLDVKYLDQSDLRVNIMEFILQLRRDEISMSVVLIRA
jgi:carboxypeptidase C (cathepsin A)